VANGLADGEDEPIGGGAIRNNGSLALDNCIFTGNRALYGGAIRNQGTLTVTNSMFAVNRTVSVGSRSPGDGGAIFNAGRLTIMDSGIGAYNEALSGGGILNWADGDVTLDHVMITNNTASYGGGGVYNGDHGTLNITDSWISNNHTTLTDTLAVDPAALASATMIGKSYDYQQHLQVTSGSYGRITMVVAQLVMRRHYYHWQHARNAQQGRRRRHFQLAQAL
jgi:hypothetical protein